jgi:hypothetical protein
MGDRSIPIEINSDDLEFGLVDIYGQGYLVERDVRLMCEFYYVGPYSKAQE